MKNFAARLKMARTMKGWSMQDLSNQLNGNLSKQAIGKYEKGEMLPGAKTLNALCDILDVKFDFFNRPSSIEINPSFRKRQKLSKTKQAEIIERTKDYIERYIEAEELVAIDGAFAKPKIDTFCQNVEDAERIAHEFRKEKNLGEDPLYNIVELLEDWGIKVYHDFFGSNSLSGLSSILGEDRALIVINKDLTLDHQRFTAMHELGHIIMTFPIGMSEKEIEKMCNRFAGAMLMPSNQLRRELGEHRNNILLKELVLINAQYGISPQALLYRSKELGIITEYLFTQQYKNINARYGRHANLGVYAGKEKSNRLFQILCRGIAEESLTSGKAASLLNIRVAELRDRLIVEPQNYE
ncbi:MAG: XRE family transcriptional regulator [Saprospiraceae bacterium]|nr:XRE family transcriptional regulator [Saprospiraceae bacterium]